MADKSKIINHYSKTGYEDTRTKSDISRFEYERSKEIIARYLPANQSVILDIGGASGAYSFWLAHKGHKVHLVDLVPRHIEMAKEKSRKGQIALESIEVGNAKELSFDDNFADIVLLMGPLYHIQEKEERMQALRECLRVLKPGGIFICAAISRFASMLDGFRSDLYDDPEFEKIVDKDLETGKHNNTSDNEKIFTTAYFHEPEELKEEVKQAGFNLEKLIGVEGPLGLFGKVNHWLDKKDKYY